MQDCYIKDTNSGKFNVISSVISSFIFLFVLICAASGCEYSNAKKIAFIKQNQQATNERIEAKQKNNLVIPHILKEKRMLIDENEYL